MAAKDLDVKRHRLWSAEVLEEGDQLRLEVYRTAAVVFGSEVYQAGNGFLRPVEDGMQQAVVEANQSAGGGLQQIVRRKLAVAFRFDDHVNTSRARRLHRNTGR